MTGAPHSLAETPGRRIAAGHDQLLKAVRVSGSVYLNGCFSAPFGIICGKIVTRGRRWRGFVTSAS